MQKNPVSQVECMDITGPHFLGSPHKERRDGPNEPLFHILVGNTFLVLCSGGPWQGKSTNEAIQFLDNSL